MHFHRFVIGTTKIFNEAMDKSKGNFHKEIKHRKLHSKASRKKKYYKSAEYDVQVEVKAEFVQNKLNDLRETLKENDLEVQRNDKQTRTSKFKNKSHKGCNSWSKI